jgi:NAD(P)-dependent dehydrogenase (short-subunit alcohol dehydrogenase family)
LKINNTLNTGGNKHMGQSLQNKSAVVTGGGSGGIGKAVAMALAAEGAHVVVNDIGRDPEGNYIADKTVKEIKATGGNAVANYDSVATVEGGKNIIGTAVKSFGKIDILVNCAGNMKRLPVAEVTEDVWKSIIDVHLNGHFNCSRPAVLEMMKQKSGRIINFSSRGAMSASGNIAYSSAKAGILGFTAGLAIELKDTGITVNCIVPSADTKLFPGARPKFALETIPATISLDPDYIAPLVAYLATDDAKNITCQFFYASGGDVCIYPRMLQLPGGTPMFVRKNGKWTVEELNKVLPPLLGVG